MRFAAGKQVLSAESGTRNRRQVYHMRFAAGQGQRQRQGQEQRQDPEQEQGQNEKQEEGQQGKGE